MNLLIGILFALLAIFIGLSFLVKDNDRNLERVLLITLLVLMSLRSFLEFFFPNPSLLDVYRGRTELQVRGVFVNDSTFVPKDTVVIWKEEYK